MYSWLRSTIFEDDRALAVFTLSFIEGGVCLLSMLWFAFRGTCSGSGRPADEVWTRPEGALMLYPNEFNKVQECGIGFKTTESDKVMRAPLRKEAQHLQFVGNTGVGKMQPIRQRLRQIRQRGDSAIVRDPACEYIQRFYDAGRGDIVLNPLDNRCPYGARVLELFGRSVSADWGSARAEQRSRRVSKRERKNRQRREASCRVDATFSASKSVSLTVLVGGDDRIREVHAAAVTVALNELEKYTQARIGGNNPADNTGKVIAAKLEHISHGPVNTFSRTNYLQRHLGPRSKLLTQSLPFSCDNFC